MSKKVSIIIPVYNVEPWLRECLDSVIHQTLREIEIICVNDASPDNSLNILNEYAQMDSRLIILDETINKGLSAVRNIGANHATGKYIYFFDSDDVLKLDAMEKLYNVASSQDLDILCFEGETFYESSDLEAIYKGQEKWCARSKEYSGIKTGKELFLEMFQNNDYKVVVWILFIKRSFYMDNKLSFVPGILYEDNLFTFILFLKAEKASHIWEKLYLRRVRKGSITTSRKAFSNSYGFFVCVINCISALNEHDIQFEDKIFFYKEIDKLVWHCRNEYKQLSDDEKNKYLLLPTDEAMLFRYLIVNYTNLERTNTNINNKVKYLESEQKDLLCKCKSLKKTHDAKVKHLNDVKSGLSFRIGRVITYLPRKIRDTLKQIRRCIK